MNLKQAFTAAACLLLAFGPGFAGDAKAEKLTAEVKAQVGELDEKYPDRQWRDLQKAVLKALEYYEDKVEDLEGDVEKLTKKLDKKNKGRYPVEVEFALVYECIYGGGSSRMTEEEYRRLASCCAESLANVQSEQKFSEYKKLEGKMHLHCSE